MSWSAQKPVLASAFRHVGYLISQGRPLHLAGGFVFNGLGIAVVLFFGASVNWTAAVWCQLAITATQLMTPYSNDYFDQYADAVTNRPE